MRCDAFGWNQFCGSCGSPYLPDGARYRGCPGCRAMVSSEFCSHCGTLVASSWMKKFERGEVDWTVESSIAAEALEKVLHLRPSLAMDLYTPDAAEKLTSLSEGVAAAFGRST